MKFKQLITALAAMLLLFNSAANAALISTTFAGGNGSSGNMFDLTNISSSSIELTGKFEGNFRNNGNVEAWYRIGTYVGNENSSAGWTFLGSTDVTTAGQDNATSFDIGNSLVVDAGQVIGLFFYHDDDGMEYTNGTNSYNDGVVQLDLGIGKGPSSQADVFGGEYFSPRTWNGSIEYTVSAVPVPAAAFMFAPAVLGFLGLRRRAKQA